MQSGTDPSEATMVEDALSELRQSMSELSETVARRSQAAASQAKTIVRENPVATGAVVVGIGALIAVVLIRRARSRRHSNWPQMPTVSLASVREIPSNVASSSTVERIGRLLEDLSAQGADLSRLPGLDAIRDWFSRAGDKAAKAADGVSERARRSLH